MQKNSAFEGNSGPDVRAEYCHVPTNTVKEEISMNHRIDTVARARQLAAERNMPLSQLAKQCGINHSTLSVSRARGGQLQVETIFRICDVLGVTPAEFFSPPSEHDEMVS